MPQVTITINNQQIAITQSANTDPVAARTENLANAAAAFPAVFNALATTMMPAGLTITATSSNIPLSSGLPSALTPLFQSTVNALGNALGADPQFPRDLFTQITTPPAPAPVTPAAPVTPPTTPSTPPAAPSS